MTFQIDNILPDPHDPRDQLYGASDAPLKTNVNLAQYLIDIENQGRTNSCTAHAGTSAMELLLKEFKPAKAVELSRLFLYYNTRKLSNLQGKDGGAYVRDVVKSLEKFGCVPEELYPFDESKVQEEPPQNLYTKAKKYKIKRYLRVKDIRGALNDGIPVIIGATIRRPIFYVKGPISSHVTYFSTANYNQAEKVGGHAMVVVGYDNIDNTYIITNSWGTAWGDNGLFKIPRDMIDPDIHDAWAIVGIKNWMDTLGDSWKNWYKSILEDFKKSTS